jgi:hypothetical protein
MRFSRIISWTTKGGPAILDQGLFAGTNFVANILLARWLSPATGSETIHSQEEGWIRT